MYNKEVEELRKMRKQQISYEEKITIIKEHEEKHKTLKAICEEYDISKSYLCYILKGYRQNGKESLKDMKYYSAEYKRKVIKRHFEDGIDIENHILRKGAISAQENETVIIPMNMRDGCLIGKGKGNADWNCSAPHGAGRLMSRSDARSSFTLSQYKKEMQGIYSTSVSRDTLDESPMAYKPMESILSKIDPTVEVIERITPIYNFKTGEE